MVDLYVDLKQIATGLDKDDLIKVIAAWYAEHAYGVEAEEDDLAVVEFYIAEDAVVLLSFENTLANLVRLFFVEDFEDDDFVDATAFFKSGKVRKRLILSQETCLYMHDTFGEEGFTHI